MICKVNYQSSYFSPGINGIFGSDIALYISEIEMNEESLNTLLQYNLIYNLKNKSNKQFIPDENEYYKINIFEVKFNNLL